ncbi:MAG: Uma2 family endonuclease [Gemmatimonadaceae bacterium]
MPYLIRRAYAMAMPVQHSDWTVEMLHALPDDGNRYEIIDGELLVSPSPSHVHQRAIGELHVVLHTYLTGTDLEAVFAPFDVTWSSRTEVQPDLLVAPSSHLRELPRGRGASLLTLAVEVLSPSTARTDRHQKRRLYGSQGVPEYWIVDTGSRLLERWRPGDEEPDVLLTTLTWQPPIERAPLILDVTAYFAAVHR